jgi:hypothetical protein
MEPNGISAITNTPNFKNRQHGFDPGGCEWQYYQGTDYLGGNLEVAF